jgi:RNA polymerase sigma-70 factor (ECF subfamily)
VATAALTVREAFEDVYLETLPTVWRVVSARIPDRREAEDVTSDVFVRALQSWPRYDPALGTPTAWLCGIAHRAIADWWRTSRRAKTADRVLAFAGDGSGEERLAGPSAYEPEPAAIRSEQLDALRRGLAALPERERDALVLRFAGGLRATEVGIVLGLSAGATRMLLFRSLLKLKDRLARASSGETSTEMHNADVLDRAIDDVLARRGASIPDVLLERVVRFMAVLHDVEVPPELPAAVRACIECEAEKPSQDDAGPGNGSWFAWLRYRLPATLRTVTVPACVICAAGPGVVAPLTALGLVGPAFAFHASSIVLAPLNLVVLWRRSRVHGDARGLLIGAVGLVLILVHMGGHVASLDDALGLGVQDALILAGTSLLMLGWFVDWRATRRIALAWRPASA